MVCRWPQSQEGDWKRPHLCKLARHEPWPVRKQFIRDHVWWRRSKPGCQTVGSVAVVWLTTEAVNQSSLHCVIVSTDVLSDHVGCRDASRGVGYSKTSAYTGQFRWAGGCSELWVTPWYCLFRGVTKSGRYTSPPLPSVSSPLEVGPFIRARGFGGRVL